MSGDDGFLAPPPGLVPVPQKANAPKPEPVAPQDFISLPPGVSLPDLDSGTMRVDQPRRGRPQQDEVSAPVFMPLAVPGRPNAIAPPSAIDPRSTPASPASSVEETVIATPAEVAPPADAALPAVDEATRVAVGRRVAPAWRMSLPDGVEVLLERTALIGRSPATNPRWPDAQLLPVGDPRKSVSKTHAALELAADGTLWAHDLDSTNGVYLSYANGDETDVEPGVRVAVENAAVIHLGEFELRVHRV